MQAVLLVLVLLLLDQHPLGQDKLRGKTGADPVDPKTSEKCPGTLAQIGLQPFDLPTAHPPLTDMQIPAAPQQCLTDMNGVTLPKTDSFRHSELR